MRSSMLTLGLFLAGSLAASASAAGARQMSFFITSTGPGNGANLGGLEGADRHCQKLANAAGAGNQTWRAYLSTQGKDFKDPNVVNARDRIGSGPWYSAKGVLIANNVDELHSPENNLNKETALDEIGNLVNGGTEKPKTHDIITGSCLDGTSIAPRFFTDKTCGDCTSNGEGAATLGHHDRVGPNDNAWTKSWNSSHVSKGCSAEALKKTGGNGLFYCFAER